MSGPSDDHERRVRILEAEAMLAGFTEDVSLGLDLQPDVTRADRRGRSLLVGDAKATELPHNPATLARLARYVVAARPCVDAGADLNVVIAHRACPKRGVWLTAVVRSLSEASLEAGWARSVALDDACVLAWVYVPAAALLAHSRAPSGSSSIVLHHGSEPSSCPWTPPGDRPILRRRWAH